MRGGKHVDRMWYLDSRLTKREGCILMLVYRGFTDVEIAEKLFISPFTAKRHVINMLCKLDMNNRTALAGYAGYIIGYISKEKDALRDCKERLTVLNEYRKSLQNKM